MNLMLSLNWSLILRSKCVKLTHLIKPCMILGVLYFWFLMGKSSWVPSRTQGLFPTCCRWPILLWVLQILPSPCRGWELDCRAQFLLVNLSMMLLWDMTTPGNVFKPMKLCTELCCFRETNLVCNILFWTPMDIIRMLLVKCCNRWCVVLNHAILACRKKST
jgi:hypothetical protein